jgi:hypothetical protein
MIHAIEDARYKCQRNCVSFVNPLVLASSNHHVARKSPSPVSTCFPDPFTGPSESDFHGPYNKLLHHIFPWDGDFTVVPQYLPDSRGSADFIVLYDIQLKNKPVLILELNPPNHLHLISKRQAADEQLRDRMADISGQRPPFGHHGP